MQFLRTLLLVCLSAFVGNMAFAKVDKVTFTNKLVDGKKTWLPAEATAKAGDKLEITLINTLAEPHGFSAPGLTQDIVVNANETKVVTVEKTKKGTYAFKCQLHPAHVGGKVTIN